MFDLLIDKLKIGNPVCGRRQNSAGIFNGGYHENCWDLSEHMFSGISLVLSNTAEMKANWQR
jgi:hypothetical protein